MKKILVTGAGGYIGRHVVTALLNRGANVIAADINLNEVDDRAEKIQTDIFNQSKNIFKELGSPDACLHMAWKDGFIHNSDAHMECLSVHYRFIKDITDSGLKQIAVMGTMHEIGYHEGPIDETTPCNPYSQYGIAKNALCKSTFLLLKDKEIVVQWLRAYYIYGDDKKNNSIFAKLISAAEVGKEIFPFTSGQNKYDFIHVDELARQISACVMQTKVDGIINCCSGRPISLAEKVEDFIKEHQLNINLDYGAFPDRPYDSSEVWGDNTKIKSILESMEQNHGH